jgi:hypothetical protein
MDIKGKDKVTGGWRKYVGLIIKFIICAFHQSLLLAFGSESVMYRACRMLEYMNNANRFWFENLK